MKRCPIGLWSIFLWWLAGCATINNGITQSLLIDTPGVEGAACDITIGSLLQYHIDATPATVEVMKSSEPLNVMCHKEGYKDGEVIAPPSFEGNIEENLLLTGGVSLIFVALDEMTSAHWQFPDRIDVPMSLKRTGRSVKEEAAVSDLRLIMEEEQRILWRRIPSPIVFPGVTMRPPAILPRMVKSQEREVTEKPAGWR